MLSNVLPIDELGSLARANARDYDTKTVAPSALDEHIAAGWEVAKKNNKLLCSFIFFAEYFSRQG